MPRKPNDDTRSVYDKALGLLARREHSARELKTKLAQRGHAATEAQPVIDQLKAQSLQSDDRFGSSLARRRAGQGYGPRRIRAELKSHGLADASLREAEGDVDVDWNALAAQQLRRRFGEAPATSREDRAKRAQFLLRRGFDAATVRAATRVALADPGDDSD